MEEVLKELQAQVRTLQGNKDRAVKQSNARMDEMQKQIDSQREEIEQLKALLRETLATMAGG